MSDIKWKREIKKQPARLVEISVLDSDLDDVRRWLQNKAKDYDLQFLLAHADDGVISGRLMSDGTLKTSDEAAKGEATAETVCPPLRLKTLQQARLFGKDAELLLWRDGDNDFHARLIADGKDDSQPHWKDAFDEVQLLWGTQGLKLPHGFTLLEDGAQGLRHAVPLELDATKQRARLRVRHYLANEDFARVSVSRLVAIETEEK